MAQWSIEDLLREMKDLDKIFQKRANSSLVEKTLKSVLAKLRATPDIGPSAFLQIMDALEALELPQNIKDNIIEVCEEKTSEFQVGAVRVTATPQSMRQVYNYLSSKEWEKIQSQGLMEASATLVGRMRKCGLISLKEDSKKAACAFLLYLQQAQGHPLPPAGEQKKLANHVRQCFVSSSQAPAVAGYSKYLPFPNELGEETCIKVFFYVLLYFVSFHIMCSFVVWQLEDFLKSCYEDGDPPAHVPPDVGTSVGALLKPLPVRNTHALLQPEHVPAQKHQDRAPATPQNSPESM